MKANKAESDKFREQTCARVTIANIININGNGSERAQRQKEREMLLLSKMTTAIVSCGFIGHIFVVVQNEIKILPSMKHLQTCILDRTSDNFQTKLCIKYFGTFALQFGVEYKTGNCVHLLDGNGNVSNRKINTMKWIVCKVENPRNVIFYTNLSDDSIYMASYWAFSRNCVTQKVAHFVITMLPMTVVTLDLNAYCRTNLMKSHRLTVQTAC